MESSPEATPPDAPRASRRAYVQLLGVLVLAWALFAAHAFSGKEIAILGVTVAKVDIEGYLRSPAAADASRPPERFAGIAPVEAPKLAPRPAQIQADVVPAALRVADRSPQRILIFGDSMVKALMVRLSDYCAENGHEMHAASWYGSTTIGWAVQAKLDALLREHDPTFVIVVLGASEVPARDVASHEKFIRQIVEKIGARKLVWIGPPNTERDTGINDLIESVVGHDRFFRSEGLELPRYGDHIHPTPEGGRTWMENVARWLGDGSATPILMAPPTKKGPPPDLVVFQQGT